MIEAINGLGGEDLLGNIACVTWDRILTTHIICRFSMLITVVAMLLASGQLAIACQRHQDEQLEQLGQHVSCTEWHLKELYIQQNCTAGRLEDNITTLVRENTLLWTEVHRLRKDNTMLQANLSAQNGILSGNHHDHMIYCGVLVNGSMQKFFP